MAPVGLPILMALILCTVCTGMTTNSQPTSAPPPPAPTDLISVCPAFDSSVCIFARPGPPECFNDSQCTHPKKCCCTSNCGLKCQEPDRVKPGRCPDIEADCLPELTYECSSDSNCTGHKKCCKLCGTKCMDAEPEPMGSCPKVDRSDSLQCGSTTCTRDSECKTGEKCCASESGQSCVKIPTVKPGECPTSINCIWSTFTCKCDSNCSGDEKCCPICGSNCWKPV